MSGLTILNTISDVVSGYIMFYFFGILSLAFMVALIYVIKTKNTAWVKFIVCCIVMFLIATGIGIYLTTTLPRYEAIISEDINMEKFNEKYEILNERGDILVIRERV